jgi:ADP-ribose pyrophosphatase YjhB (NUDIX family)
MKVKPLVAVDCIIFGFDPKEGILKLLLINSEFKQGGVELGNWSLMTGFLEKEETIDDAANRVLHSLTGLTNIYMEQLHVFSTIFRFQPRTIAASYYALININSDHEDLIHKYSAHWVKLSKRPKLPFDHDKMVDRAVRRLRRRAITEPIGFNLLPEKFTMRQLQALYEEILGEQLDKRNFIKKISSLNILEKLREKEKESSRKGSYLYKFNLKRYQKKKEKGFVFAV